MQTLDPQLLDRKALGNIGTVALADTRRLTGEVLLRRSAHLPRESQVLIELAVRGGLSQRRIGELIGVPHGTVSRRLRRIGRLLRDPLVLRLIDGPCLLDRADRDLAIGYFVQKRSLKDLAIESGQSILQVSRRLQYVRGWHRGASAMRGKVEVGG